MMMTFFKRLFCRHRYVKMRTRMYAKNKHYIYPVTVFRCEKCGKEVFK